jgi:quinol-cytochrome oxidoreductase complex cytochrome b subunit
MKKRMRAKKKRGRREEIDYEREEQMKKLRLWKRPKNICGREIKEEKERKENRNKGFPHLYLLFFFLFLLIFVLFSLLLPSTFMHFLSPLNVHPSPPPPPLLLPLLPHPPHSLLLLLFFFFLFFRFQGMKEIEGEEDT